MRRWLLIMLLLIYPFQVSLAMADQCCVMTSSGITHHSTAQGKGAPAAEPVFLDDDADAALADPHCPACVFGQVSAVSSHFNVSPAVARHTAAITSSIPFLSSVPGSRPERPNWPAAAN